MSMIKVKKIRPLNKDRRGSIIKVVEGKITSVLLIPSKKGAVRANHYHKEDSHYVYMISGKMRYTVKDLTKKYSKKQTVVLKKGDLVYTPPMVGHAMEFLDDSVFLALATESRDKKHYENDTTKIELI